MKWRRPRLVLPEGRRERKRSVLEECDVIFTRKQRLFSLLLKERCPF
jgi:hypothetical protein